MQWNALLGQEDLLREEITRGKECLAQAQKELAESRMLLEEWPAYEERCGRNCLPCLTDSVSGKRRIERFLTGWLKRRQEQLAAVDKAITLLAARNGPTLLRHSERHVLAR
jgi:hypothetical protein